MTTAAKTESTDPLHEAKVQFPKKLWRRLKVAAAKRDLSASEFIRRAVRDHLLVAEREQI